MISQLRSAGPRGMEVKTRDKWCRPESILAEIQERSSHYITVNKEEYPSTSQHPTLGRNPSEHHSRKMTNEAGTLRRAIPEETVPPLRTAFGT